MDPEVFGLSTDMVDMRIRNEFWRDVSSVLYEITPVDDPRSEGLVGSVYSQPFGSMILGRTTFNHQICRRTPETIIRSAVDFYIVQLIIKGDYRGDFNGVIVSVRPGDIFILDLARVLDSEKEPGSRTSIVLPRAILEKCLPRRHLHGMVFDRRRATTRLLADYMIGIERVIGDLSPNEIPAVQESLSVLLASAVEGASEGMKTLTVSLPMRQRILDYIDSRLNDPLLGPDMIMRYFRVSRSHLYRAFELDGGIARIIREKRLDQAYQLLTNPAQKLSIKDVARRCGIPGGVEFSKFFKSRFGLSPKDARNIARAIPNWRSGPLVLQRHLVGEASRRGLVQNSD